jgi:hypothetical protein
VTNADTGSATGASVFTYFLEVSHSRFSPPPILESIPPIAPTTPKANPIPLVTKLGEGLSISNSPDLPGKLLVKASAKISQAPNLQALVGKPFTPVFRFLPPRVSLTARIAIAGKQILLGAFKVDLSGNLVLPTLTAANPGKYLIQVADKSGKKYFVKFSVGNK